ncbi:MAG: PDZ domain-containing protein [Acidobacteria bacterium]|nr:PDZ domain-containing protein [Acidobacteriota bacterium]
MRNIFSGVGMRFQLQRTCRHVFVAFLLALSGIVPAAAGSLPIRYLLDLRKPSSHLVQVTMAVPDATAGTELQFPAWNNLYQIRDFVRDVQQVEATCNAKPAPLARLNIDTWQSNEPCSNLEVHYAVYANQDDIFSSVLNDHRAFLNFALLLFYLPQERGRGVQVQFLLPEGWKLATVLNNSSEPGVYEAANYDCLADSPAEAGDFQEYDYEQSGATFRVVVDGGRNLYSPGRLLAALKTITAAETSLMRDVPFRRYTFFYYFPASGVGGGMEHRNGAAICVPADDMRDGLYSLEATTAHEFFHLWNVKRIRPKGLEPIDYIHGNDTSDLWFSEGVTSTYAQLILLRTGIIGRKFFYDHLASQIAELKARPARHYQSAEESGREAWLEKYADYFRPERSISYYNKGELLGYLLDLAIRHSSGNHHSLDTLMRLLNQDYAKEGRFFDDRDLEKLISKLAPGFDCNRFFRNDVDGTRDIDYDTYLGYAGLSLETRQAKVADLGFRDLKSFIGPVVVDSVEPGSGAQAAGLKSGDVLLKMNGAELNWLPSEDVGEMHPGKKVKFTVRRGGRIFDVEFRLGSRLATIYHVKQQKHPTPSQRLVREGWLEGETSMDQAAPN